MKINKKILYVIFLLIGITSCDSYLDLEPESTIGVDDFYTNTVQADIALAGIYSVFASDQVYGRDLSIIMESGTDEGYYNRRFNENWTVGLYRHTVSDSYVLNFWTSLYNYVVNNFWSFKTLVVIFVDWFYFNSNLFINFSSI